MLGLKRSVALGLALLVSNGAAQSCGAQQRDAASSNSASANQGAGTQTPAQKPTPQERKGAGVSAQPLTISEGGFGPVEEPFLAVIRDAETYATLRTLLTDLPELRSDFFAAHTVVAAFLGTRRSGGYHVEMTNAGGVLRVVERTPEKGAMVTQAIGQPFKIAYVPAAADTSLRLEVAGPWPGAMRSYRVTSGGFKQSGGIAGRSEEFALKGNVQTARLGKLVTVGLDLSADKTTKARALQTFATGTVGDGGAFRLPRLESGTLVDSPNGGLRAEGQLSDADNKLSLTFEPLPDNVADGFDGSGKLDAASAAAPPKKPADTNKPM